MARTFNIAVVGATGAVGEVMLDILAERNFPIDTLYAIAGERSAGSRVKFGKKEVTVKLLDDFDFKQVDIAIFSAGADISATYAPIAVDAGAIVIDNTSHFRYDDAVPLVIAEVNAHLLDGFDSGIIANPNCSTMQMLVALKPIYDAVGIDRINVATYQAVSGCGRKGGEELAKQTMALLSFNDHEPQVFSQQIAFNVIPHIDEFLENGYSREEMKMVWETQKIFDDTQIKVNPTAVRVPVFYGHCEAVHIETRAKLSAFDARELLSNAPGICVMDEPENGIYPTPAGDSAGKDAVFVGRIREDISHPMGLNLWVVSDNLRKGAALNTVQIAEILANNHL